MKKIIIILLLIIPLILIYIYFAKDDSKIQSDTLADNPNHLVPTPTEGDKNSEKLMGEKKYNVNSEEVNYYSEVIGFYSEPSEENSFPGIIMIHEWWGLNDHIKEMAEKLAGQGYRVLAVDLFGTVATTPEEARAQVTGLDQEEALKNMQSAEEFLQKKGVNKIASLGWCFGGGQSLRVSVNNKMDATVIYYGSLLADENLLANLQGPVLGIFGSEDGSIPVEEVNNFEESLNKLQITNDINIYQGVGHAFANPSGNNYSPEETEDAWNKTLEFLEVNLKN